MNVCINDLSVFQLVELSSSNSSETAAVQLQSSVAAVTQFAHGARIFIVIWSNVKHIFEVPHISYTGYKYCVGDAEMSSHGLVVEATGYKSLLFDEIYVVHVE